MTEMFFLRSFSPIPVMSTPSIKMEPSGSTSLRILPIRELFPAPVRPTTPIYKDQGVYCIPTVTNCTRIDVDLHVLSSFILLTFSPGWIVKHMSFNAYLSSFKYEIITWSNVIWPLQGQYLGRASSPLVWAGASWSSSVYCTILSTEVIWNSTTLQSGTSVASDASNIRAFCRRWQTDQIPSFHTQCTRRSD